MRKYDISCRKKGMGCEGSDGFFLSILPSVFFFIFAVLQFVSTLHSPRGASPPDRNLESWSPICMFINVDVYICSLLIMCMPIDVYKCFFHVDITSSVLSTWKHLHFYITLIMFICSYVFMFLGQNHLFHCKLFSPLERSCFTVTESGRDAACGDYHDLQSF